MEKGVSEWEGQRVRKSEKSQLSKEVVLSLGEQGIHSIVKNQMESLEANADDESGE